MRRRTRVKAKATKDTQVCSASDVDRAAKKTKLSVLSYLDSVPKPRTHRSKLQLNNTEYSQMVKRCDTVLNVNAFASLQCLAEILPAVKAKKNGDSADWIQAFVGKLLQQPESKFDLLSTRKKMLEVLNEVIDIESSDSSYYDNKVPLILVTFSIGVHRLLVHLKNLLEAEKGGLEKSDAPMPVSEVKYIITAELHRMMQPVMMLESQHNADMLSNPFISFDDLLQLNHDFLPEYISIPHLKKSGSSDFDKLRERIPDGLDETLPPLLGAEAPSTDSHGGGGAPPGGSGDLGLTAAFPMLGLSSPSSAKRSSSHGVVGLSPSAESICRALEDEACISNAAEGTTSSAAAGAAGGGGAGSLCEIQLLQQACIGGVGASFEDGSSESEGTIDDDETMEYLRPGSIVLAKRSSDPMYHIGVVAHIAVGPSNGIDHAITIQLESNHHYHSQKQNVQFALLGNLFGRWDPEVDNPDRVRFRPLHRFQVRGSRNKNQNQRSRQLATALFVTTVEGRFPNICKRFSPSTAQQSLNGAMQDAFGVDYGDAEEEDGTMAADYGGAVVDNQAEGSPNHVSGEEPNIATTTTRYLPTDSHRRLRSQTQQNISDQTHTSEVDNTPPTTKTSPRKRRGEEGLCSTSNLKQTFRDEAITTNTQDSYSSEGEDIPIKKLKQQQGTFQGQLPELKESTNAQKASRQARPPNYRKQLAKSRSEKKKPRTELSLPTGWRCTLCETLPGRSPKKTQAMTDLAVGLIKTAGTAKGQPFTFSLSPKSLVSLSSGYNHSHLCSHPLPWQFRCKDVLPWFLHPYYGTEAYQRWDDMTCVDVAVNCLLVKYSKTFPAYSDFLDMLQKSSTTADKFNSFKRWTMDIIMDACSRTKDPIKHVFDSAVFQLCTSKIKAIEQIGHELQSKQVYDKVNSLINEYNQRYQEQLVELQKVLAEVEQFKESGKDNENYKRGTLEPSDLAAFKNRRNGSARVGDPQRYYCFLSRLNIKFHAMREQSDKKKYYNNQVRSRLSEHQQGFQNAAQKNQVQLEKLLEEDPAKVYILVRNVLSGCFFENSVVYEPTSPVATCYKQRRLTAKDDTPSAQHTPTDQMPALEDEEIYAL